MLKKKNVTSPTDAQLNKAMNKIEEELHAIIFMYKTDRHKYGNILDQMENNASNFLVTNDNQHGYSSDEDIAETPYAEHDFTAIQEANEEKEESEEEDTGSENGNSQDELSNKSFTDEDEYEEYEGFAFLHNDVVCSTQDKAGIPKTWILLDSQSTVDVFSNPRLLTNIRSSKTTLTLHCNARRSTVTKKGDLKGYGTAVLSRRHSKYSVSTQGPRKVQGYIRQFHNGWVCGAQVRWYTPYI